ncbi:hypothetical protein BD289DRAFT_143822 [Coniella lustricola]|uniref:Uncharacterized protein n=1 Tax=Coniella lustricola TaxID=2025994 RepID=A0A2T3AEV8_9PEZI|nr:hypothetical protein BD289DRAFT_143822 [Coniella lustricola]
MSYLLRDLQRYRISCYFIPRFGYDPIHLVYGIIHSVILRIMWRWPGKKQGKKRSRAFVTLCGVGTWLDALLGWCRVLIVCARV